MKKKSILIMFLLFAALSPLMADKLIFTEFGVSYSSMLTPRVMENNSTGSYDTAAFDAKIGVEIMKWADIYAGAGFQGFIDRENSQQNYSFWPIYGGIRANIFPDFCVYPDFTFEYGRAIANRHTQYVINPMFMGDRDNSWLADYYSFGLGINLKVSDVSVLSLRIERPTYSNLNVSDGELQVIKTGFAFKILY